jgi:hypothetical protein
LSADVDPPGEAGPGAPQGRCALRPARTGTGKRGRPPGASGGAGRRPALIAGLILLGTLVVGAFWIAVTGLMAQSELNRVRAEIPRLRAALLAGDLTRARSLNEQIQKQAQRAHELTTGPAWWVVANVPVLGTPAQTSRTLASSADRISRDAIPAVLRLAQILVDDQPRLSSGIDLSPLARAAPELTSAANVTHQAVQAAEDSSSSWLPFVASARQSVVRQLRRLDEDLVGAQRAVRVVLPMLGQSGKQRYFIGFLNEAESRGLGGIPGAFAIATADHGRITFDRFGSDSDLHGARADVYLGVDYAARYAQDDPTGVFQNSDISPDFRYAAQIWAGMWEKKTGQHIDGALAIDPTALSYLLKVTGPATLHDGTQVTAKNAVVLTQQTQYALFPNNARHDTAERKAYLISIARAVAHQLTRGGDARGLVKALSHAAQARRLVVWSAKASVEAELELADWAGALGNTYGGPLTGFTVTNAAASKLDYYLDRTMTYQRADCRAGGTATATMRFSNRAPRSGLPPYVVIRADRPPSSARPGDNKLLVTYYASADARIVGVSLDGKPLSVITLPEGDTLAASLALELPAGATRTLTVTIAEPAAYGDVQVLSQPLVRPARITTRAACG